MDKDKNSTGRSGEGATWRVLDDFPDVMPVTPEELDVIEAFLLAELRATISGDSGAETRFSRTQGWEPPQTHAEIKSSAKGRGNRR